MDASSSAGPGVIVVAERSVGDLLASCGVTWNVQEALPSISAMWEALADGRLDQRSRVLVFSDSLLAGTSTDDAELTQTARAIVAMAHAGAHVFVALWRPDRRARVEALIDESARAQSVDPATLPYHVLHVELGGRAVLDAMRGVLATEIAFPDHYDAIVHAPLLREVGGLLPVAAPPDEPMMDQPAEILNSVLPSEPPPPPPLPLVVATEEPAAPDIDDPTLNPDDRLEPAVPALVRSTDYPPSASLELLERPKLRGQTTITVTSSKGGSGKSTVAILLASAIARAASETENPLSVCLVDLDTRNGQVASFIGKFMPTALNIRVQPVWDEDRIRRYLVRADSLGIDTLLAPIRPRTADTVGPDFYQAIVRSLQRMYDVVIMDTSVQYLEPLVADVALGEADEILFVTTLAATSVQGMARALREITAPTDEAVVGVDPAKIGIVVNQSVADVGMERDKILEAGLGIPVVGVIPLATMDVLTATNLNCMDVLLDGPVLGPAFNELARACLPGRDLGPWIAPAAEGTLESADELEPSHPRRD